MTKKNASPISTNELVRVQGKIIDQQQKLLVELLNRCEQNEAWLTSAADQIEQLREDKEHAKLLQQIKDQGKAA